MKTKLIHVKQLAAHIVENVNCHELKSKPRRQKEDSLYYDYSKLKKEEEVEDCEQCSPYISYLLAMLRTPLIP